MQDSYLLFHYNQNRKQYASICRQKVDQYRYITVDRNLCKFVQEFYVVKCLAYLVEDNSPGLKLPPKQPMRLSPKTTLRGVFVQQLCTVECYISGCFALLSKWKGLYVLSNYSWIISGHFSLQDFFETFSVENIYFSINCRGNGMIMVSQIIENRLSGAHYRVFRGSRLGWEPSG